MKIRKVIEQERGWRRFDLNVGGFTIRGCRWHPGRRFIAFPQRYDRDRYSHRVVFAFGQTVKRLRELLESDQTDAPRDRRPCRLGIRLLGKSRHERREGWIVFNFTVRGFTIRGCRWHPRLRSIQLPVTYHFDDNHPQPRYVKNRVVCAYGAHINRLRDALEAENVRVTRRPVPDRAEEAVPA